MKVLVGTFVTESNAGVPELAKISNYDLAFGEACITKMDVKDIYDEAGIELVPSIYADAGGNGVVSLEAFEYIEKEFIKAVKLHLHEIDGIYLFLHGASEVEEIGSGDHHIIKSIREVVGPYLPIAVACDPHGNCCKEYVEAINIFRSYRESPHTDARDTKRLVSKMLCELLHNRQNIHASYRKLPLILGGEQSVSTDEPVLSINHYMDDMEKDPRIMSASWHVGYIRHDSDVAGCGVVVVPSTQDDQEYAEQKVQELADYVWDKRKEFHYTGLTASLAESLKMALECKDSPVFITDSGDNVTSGAPGWNTIVLREVLKINNLQKKFLFATICDPLAYEQLEKMDIGEKTKITLGFNHNEWSAPVDLEVTIKSKGPLMGFMYRPHDKAFGYSVTVSVNNLPIDIMVASTHQPMVEGHQFSSANVNWDDYDVIVVKQGYIFWELKQKGKLCVMALTDGTTLQDTRALPFKRIMRPMFPIDQI